MAKCEQRVQVGDEGIGRVMANMCELSFEYVYSGLFVLRLIMREAERARDDGLWGQRTGDALECLGKMLYNLP